METSNKNDQIIQTLNMHTEIIQLLNEMIKKLYQNYNVQAGWEMEINKDKLNYLLEVDHCSGITASKREQQIIISLTSYPDRMYDLKYTLYSLLHQSLKPDRIILWLAREQFPNGENDIAPSLLALLENGLSIMWCEDIKSYKKLIPSLEAFPDAVLVTADDDVYYPENWLESLYNSYLEFPECIHCHRAHRVAISGNGFVSYQDWEHCTTFAEPTYYAFPTGVGGILYPPAALHKDVSIRESFRRLAPTADDVWFWAMALLNHTKIKTVKNNMSKITYINYAREIGLCDESTLSMENNGPLLKNDISLNNVLTAYPNLLNILLSEFHG